MINKIVYRAVSGIVAVGAGVGLAIAIKENTKKEVEKAKKELMEEMANNNVIMFESIKKLTEDSKVISEEVAKVITADMELAQLTRVGLNEHKEEIVALKQEIEVLRSKVVELDVKRIQKNIKDKKEIEVIMTEEKETKKRTKKEQ